MLYKAQAEINARIADAEAKEGRTIWVCQMLYDIISLILYISIASFRSYRRSVAQRWTRHHY